MTTIAAVKKEKCICIASDSLALFGSRKEIDGNHVYGDGKLIQIGPNYIGMAGHPSWELILKHYFLKQKKISEWKTEDQVFDLFNDMHLDLKEKYHLTPPSLKFVPFESSEFELLVINSYGIFEVDFSRVVRQHKKYAAIGSGEAYALGSISATYDMIEDPEELATIGIKAAAQFDRKTEIPVHTYCIDTKL